MFIAESENQSCLKEALENSNLNQLFYFRSSGLVVVPVCVSGVKCETTRNVTSYNFGTAASNGLSSGMSSGGGKMRRERGLHYLSRCVQEQVSDS